MGFDQSHYVPIVKGKQGELAALSKTDSKLMKHFTPLSEIPPIPPKYVEGQEEPIQSKSIDAHVEYVGEKFGAALVDLPTVFVDGLYIETEDEVSNGASPVSAIFEKLRALQTEFSATRSQP
jgi:Beta protein